MNIWRKYLLWFAHEHVEFRFAEIESLLSLFSVKMKFVVQPKGIEPFWIVQLPTENDAKLITNRSVSIKFCIELWAYSNNLNNLHTILQNNNKKFYEDHFNANTSFKIEVETFCRHFTQKEKVDKLETFSYLPVEGPVRLNNPDILLQYIEYYGIVANNPPVEPYQVFFGRWVASGLRQLLKKLSLKTRKFIGNTSMDPQLSLLMANQAKIKHGDIIIDPFVGSGSLLVAAAELGAYVYGTDIDYLMLHARSRPSRIRQKERDKNESIKANMEQYNLNHKYLDVLVNDFATNFWRDGFEFDAIITDPPYGIRESTERVGTNRENCNIKEEHSGTHIPAKIEYGISNIYNDLIKFALKHLKIGGRLVCWFPIFRDDYNINGLPNHPCFKLIANCEQILTKVTSRRLLTFEKIRNPTNEEFNLCNTITDFREKYFVLREETRKERRIREAKIREENRQKYNMYK